MLPESYVKRMKELLKDDADSYLESFNQKYYAGLRVNTLKISPEEFKGLSPVPIEPIPWTDKGFYFDQNLKPAKHPYYFAGLYYIQEPSAMSPAAMLPISENDKVLDLCAAPGGKSTELGAKLKGTGMLVSNDISASRAKALLKNLELFGVKNVVVTNEAPIDLLRKFEGFFDKILVDAPCSGEGMFRKDPSIIKNWEQYGVEYYAKIQREIILQAADMLKPGGYMVYSTCTFSPQEDEQTIAYLMENRPYFEAVDLPFFFGDYGHPEWMDSEDESDPNFARQIKKGARLWPHKIKGEGHFVILLRKAEDAPVTLPKISTLKAEDSPFDRKVLSGKKKATKPNRITKKKGDRGYDEEEKKGALPESLDDFYAFMELVDLPMDKERFILQKDRIYYLPEGMYDFRGIRLLRTGLFVGELKNKRFEPSQAFACSLKAEEFHLILNLKGTKDEVIRYLKGETLELNPNELLEDLYLNEGGHFQKVQDEKKAAGWCLVCVDGYSLGFGKINQGVLKNKYLPGWRWM